MGWRTHLQIGEDGTVHTWPQDDRPHSTEPGQPFCWCDPTLEEGTSGAVLVIHHDELDRSQRRHLKTAR